ncbi:hypothetical protein BY996DRAFT_6457672 [Phakopsora pachyrhizi]|nr:hypothetical protein BY996DRAFT_6457672 [Phakopsora pachyrhizi]
MNDSFDDKHNNNYQLSENHSYLSDDAFHALLLASLPESFQSATDLNNNNSNSKPDSVLETPIFNQLLVHQINQITTSHQSINQQQHSQDKLVEKTVFVLFLEMAIFYHMGPLRAIAGGCGLRKHYRFDKQEMCTITPASWGWQITRTPSQRKNTPAKKLLGGDYKQREMIGTGAKENLDAEVSLGYYLHLKTNHYDGKPNIPFEYFEGGERSESQLVERGFCGALAEVSRQVTVTPASSVSPTLFPELLLVSSSDSSLESVVDTDEVSEFEPSEEDTAFSSSLYRKSDRDNNPMDGQLPRAEILGLGNSSGSFNQQHHSIFNPKATATASSSSSSSTSTSKQQQQQHQHQQSQSKSQFRPMTTDFNDSSPLFSELDDQNRMLINKLEFLFNQNSQQQQSRAENESIYSNNQQRNSVQAQGPELGSIIGSTNLSNNWSARIRIEDGFKFFFGKQQSVDHTSQRDERVMDVLESFDENQMLESID